MSFFVVMLSVRKQKLGLDLKMSCRRTSARGARAREEAVGGGQGRLRTILAGF